MKDANEEQKWTLHPSDVDLYFKSKIMEATEKEDYLWLRLLKAAQVRWDIDKKMEMSMAREINVWSRETYELAQILDLEYVESRRRGGRQRKTVRHTTFRRLHMVLSCFVAGWSFWQGVQGNFVALITVLAVYLVCDRIYTACMRRGARKHD